MARFSLLLPPKKEGRMDSLKTKIQELEKEEIVRALDACNWVMARAAKKLGITERMIGYKVRKYGIQRGDVQLGRAQPIH
jgi:Nif-specific regulatory protein